MFQSWYANLHHAWAMPAASGRIRVDDADFQVTEINKTTPCGSGEHLWLWIEKRNTNTLWLAQQLARRFAVRPVAVGFAGLKDRHAITRQWFSVCLPGRSDHTLPGAALENVRVLKAIRHTRKLKRGGLRGNRFEIRVRDIDLREAVEAALRRISDFGVPNYFGPQRFGRAAGNLHRARQWVENGKGKTDGMTLSAMRSFLFNEVLSVRVADGSWHRPVAGETYQFSDGASIFQENEVSEDLLQRVIEGTLHPTGPLVGIGEAHAGVAVERGVLSGHSAWVAALQGAGLVSSRRALRVIPGDFSWRWKPDGFQLRFDLPAGCFATAVLREIVQLRE